MDILNRHHLRGTWTTLGSSGAASTSGAMVYVGRGTPFGNPFRIGHDGDRAQVIEKFRVWLNERIDEDDPVVMTALRGLSEDSALVCSCAPAPCHAEVIRDLWYERVKPTIKSGPATGHYAGIGSRDTPAPVCDTMRRVATRLAQRGFTLRSGGAKGADIVFADGTGGDAQIFLPWRGFREIYYGSYAVVQDQPESEAFRIAAHLHPGWAHLSDPVRALMARSIHQILGADLRSPCDFVVCWTPDGAQTEAQRSQHTGGTGQGIALADRWGIPVFNLHHQDALDRLSRWLEEHPLNRPTTEPVHP